MPMPTLYCYQHCTRLSVLCLIPDEGVSCAEGKMKRFLGICLLISSALIGLGMLYSMLLGVRLLSVTQSLFWKTVITLKVVCTLFSLQSFYIISPMYTLCVSTAVKVPSFSDAVLCPVVRYPVFVMSSLRLLCSHSTNAGSVGDTLNVSLSVCR